MISSLNLALDQKVESARERRRQFEEHRKERIFNPRTRIIGIDTEALQQQVNDKRAREEEERKVSNAYVNDAVRQARVAQVLEKRELEDRKNLQKELDDYRKLHQPQEQRREWDLNNPNALGEQLPARMLDHDPRCGPASMQKFEGEDLNKPERLKLQYEQSRDWAGQQMKEKELERNRLKAADDFHARKMLELGKRACDLEKAEEDCRKAINLAVQNYNASLARDAKFRDDMAKQQDQDDNLTEIQNHIDSDMLCETPEQANSAFGPHRKIAYKWKGMTPDEKQAIKDTQHLQILEREKRNEEELRRDTEWASLRAAQEKEAIMLARAEDRKRKELRKLQDQQNRLLADERMHHIRTQSDAGHTTYHAEFFEQFNQSTR